MNSDKPTHVNDAIRSSTVRLIDHDGENHGVVDIKQALEIASQNNLDLVEVAPDAKPPVCKVMDYGKFQYEQKKAAKLAKSKSTVIEVKEIQLRPVTDEHDLKTKLRNAAKFLGRGNKVRFSMRFKGREMSHSELGMNLMKRVLTEFGEVVIEREPVLNGNQILMVISPKDGQTYEVEK